MCQLFWQCLFGPLHFTVVSGSYCCLKLNSFVITLNLFVFQLHLSKLETAREDDINLEIHNVQCIYNALSDIKAEVENVIKVGRKIVETDEASHQVGVTHSFPFYFLLVMQTFFEVSKKKLGVSEKNQAISYKKVNVSKVSRTASQNIAIVVTIPYILFSSRQRPRPCLLN